MGGATELLEKMEHAGHAGGHGDDHGHGGGANTGRMIGITMAMLGVMLAFCAAMVGSARTELIATMVEQSNTYNDYQAEAIKHRMMISQLQTLHALTPSQHEIHAFEEQLKGVHRSSGKEDSEDTAELKAAIALSTKELAAIITPDPEDELHFVSLIHHYKEERDVAREWAESYDELTEAHFKAAEHYEWAQLASEIGIVIASIALLLSSRLVWMASLVCGLACAIIIGVTFVGTREHIHHGEAAIAKEKGDFEKLKKDKSSEDEDDKFIKSVEEGAKAAITAHGGTVPQGHGGGGGGGGGHGGGGGGGEHGAPGASGSAPLPTPSASGAPAPHGGGGEHH